MAAPNFTIDVQGPGDVSIDNCSAAAYPSNLITYSITLTNTGTMGTYLIDFEDPAGNTPLSANPTPNSLSSLTQWSGIIQAGQTLSFQITFDIWTMGNVYFNTGQPYYDYIGNSLPYGGVYINFEPTVSLNGGTPIMAPPSWIAPMQDYNSYFTVGQVFNNLSFSANGNAAGNVSITIPNNSNYCPFGINGYIYSPNVGYYSEYWDIDGQVGYVVEDGVGGYGTVMVTDGLTPIVFSPGTHTITRYAFDFCHSTTGGAIGNTSALYSTTFTIPNCPAPTPTIAPTATICANTNQTLTASGATSYAWSPASNLSATNIANPVFNCATPGTYTYTITGSNACGQTATTNVTVTVPPLPINDLSTNHTTLCQGTPATNIGFNPRSNYTYLWTASANAPALSPMNSSLAYFTAPAINVPKTYTYTLKATENSTGCFVLKSRNVISNPNLSSATLTLTTSPLSATVCEGTTLSINRSITGANYGTLTYAWYRDNGTSAISTSANLSLTGSPTNTAAFGTQLQSYRKKWLQ